MENPPSPLAKTDNFLLYKDANGNVNVEIYIWGETIWLTQDKIAQLLGVLRPAVTKHLKNIFESGELFENPVYITFFNLLSDKRISRIFSSCCSKYSLFRRVLPTFSVSAKCFRLHNAFQNFADCRR